MNDHHDDLPATGQNSMSTSTTYKTKKKNKKKSRNTLAEKPTRSRRLTATIFLARASIFLLFGAGILHVLRAEFWSLHAKMYMTHVMKTLAPTGLPTIEPSPAPSFRYSPTTRPTPPPTAMPVTRAPTASPTTQPSTSSLPTPRPTRAPTPRPSPLPTITHPPTPLPTSRPTRAPTPRPSPLPTMLPTILPTPLPSPLPTPRGDLAQLRERFQGMRPHELKAELANRGVLKDLDDQTKASLVRALAVAVHREQWRDEWRLHVLQTRLRQVFSELQADTVDIFGEGEGNEEESSSSSSSSSSSNVRDSKKVAAAVAALDRLDATSTHVPAEQQRRAARDASAALQKLPLAIGEASPARQYEAQSVRELVKGLQGTILRALQTSPGSDLPATVNEGLGAGDRHAREIGAGGRRRLRNQQPPPVSVSARSPLSPGPRSEEEEEEEEEEKCSATPRRVAGVPVSPTVLWSFPGSGNTWLRLLLEEATGSVTTSSVFNDSSLAAILPREKADVSTAEACEGFMAVKNHVPWQPLRGGPLRPKWRRIMTLQRRSTEEPEANEESAAAATRAQPPATSVWSFSDNVCGGKVGRVLFLVRSPFRSIWAEFAREHSGDNHTGGVLVATWTTPRTPSKTCARDDWQRFALANAAFWRDQFVPGRGLYADWAPVGVSGSSSRGLVIRFEDLLSQEVAAEVLVRVASFCGFAVTRREAHCAFRSHRAGLVKRRQAGDRGEEKMEEGRSARREGSTKSPRRHRRRRRHRHGSLLQTRDDQRVEKEEGQQWPAGRGRPRRLGGSGSADPEGHMHAAVFVSAETAWTGDLVEEAWKAFGVQASACGYSRFVI